MTEDRVFGRQPIQEKIIRHQGMVKQAWLTIVASTTGLFSPIIHSLPTTFAPPPSTRPFRIASFPTPINPRMAPSLVPLLFPGDINANNRVFIIRGDREGYVVECWVSKWESVSADVVRRCVACAWGNVEWSRVERIGGRS